MHSGHFSCIFGRMWRFKSKISVENVPVNGMFPLRAERLAQPLVTKHHGWSEDGSCILRLQCFSPDPSVNFTWSTTPPATNRTLAKWLHPHSAFLLATMGEDDKVGFTCNTTTALESASHTLDVVCGRGKAAPFLARGSRYF